MTYPLVVISWWSNCLGLTCLSQLVKHTHDRELVVVQVGKSPEQKQHFRNHCPERVMELLYPETAPGEHSRVLEQIVFQDLPTAPGIWFVDHDTFIHAALEPWLRTAEQWLAPSPWCLCLPTPRQGPALTQPAFWLSPVRWPAEAPSFDPVPFRVMDVARRPDQFRHRDELIRATRDTLAVARENLIQRHQVAEFPITAEAATTHILPPFPAFDHLGGLSLFTGYLLPNPWNGWLKATVARFSNFFARCPEDWLAVEDPELLRRFQEFKEAIDV